ncbi:MAG: N-succinylglutamate 5-semialdehyde dehydrogenase [Chlamydiales bacterium]|nr:N-succinylglutamate 5-semialdehyde dehydrogenase [Chlamydiales bacterium]MCH9634943.1 N-succinylglutamate 5-semialdehyde dehydrogenase [Chlamydiales bacterium]MCH9703422.1 succinylglutamate-semialdehyde dehydrogenase [Chlamydiota bacterium]
MKHYINGEWIVGEGERFTSHNPATMEIIWEGKEANSSEVNLAVLAAKEAFFSWRAFTVQQRIDCLRAFAKELENKRREFAALLAEEVGKPHWEALTEVSAMLNKVPITIESYQERCQARRGGEDQVLSTHHKPQGVLAVFSPFNFPGHLPNGHIVPALISGNTVVVKGSDFTPKVGQFLAELWSQSGLPKGVFNYLQGKATTGKALVEHPDLDGLLFTGSHKVGLQIQKAFQKEVGRILALELGGNNPLIVSKVQDQKAALYMSLVSAFITTGQRCACARRLIVIDNPTFVDELVNQAAAIKIGPASERPEPFMGPLIHNEAKKEIMSLEEQLIDVGGKPLLRMRELDHKLPFLTPGIIDVTGTPHADREHFGPLLKVIHVKSLDEAIAEANNTRYGLSASILSDDQAEYNRFLEQSYAGVVNWNLPTVGASSRAPFGGVGISGNHHPTAYYAVDYCTYPVASTSKAKLELPETMNPGLMCPTAK